MKPPLLTKADCKSLAVSVGVMLLMFAVLLGISCWVKSPVTYNGSALTTANGPSWSVFFSPNGGAEDAIVKAIDREHKTILVAAYVWTERPVLDALIAAHQRGVDVQVVMDAKEVNGTNSLTKDTAKAGIPIYADGHYNIFHHKFIVFVGQGIVATGSKNFSSAAEHSNAENYLFLSDPVLVPIYLKQWEKYRGESKPVK